MTDFGRRSSTIRRRSTRRETEWADLLRPGVLAIFLVGFLFSAVWQSTLQNYSYRGSVVATVLLTVFGGAFVGVALLADSRRRR